jgi:MSHA biogenesis protein MshN
MSLINQMLKDLESRNLKDTYDEEKMLGGVQTNDAKPVKNISTLIIAGVIVLLLIAGGAWFLFNSEQQSEQISTNNSSGKVTTPEQQAALVDNSATLIAISAKDNRTGAELTLSLSSASQGLVLRLLPGKGRLELKSVSYSPELSVPLLVTRLFPGIQIESEGDNTVLTIPLAANESLKMKDASGNQGQLIVLTKTVSQTRPKPVAKKPVEEKPKPPVSVAEKKESAITTDAEPEVDPQSLPVVKKAVPLSPEQQSLRDYQRAQDELRKGDTATAMLSLRKSIGLYPLPQAYVALGGLLVNQGNNTEARNLLNQGLKALPDNSEIAYLLARLQFDAGLVEQARQSLVSALARGRSNADYLALLAAVSQQLERYTESTQAYVEALKLKPGQATWWMGLGISLEAQGKQSQAIEAFYKSLSSGLGDSFQPFVMERIHQLEGVQE